MIYPNGNTNTNYKENELEIFVFHANINPIYGIEESEYIKVEIPAPNEKSAWTALCSLVGEARGSKFYLADTRSY